jgi:hypothetical protein
MTAVRVYSNGHSINGLTMEPTINHHGMDLQSTLPKDAMAHWGLISTNTWLPCTDLTYPKSVNTSSLQLRKYQTEEVSIWCTTQHPLIKDVGDGAILFCWVIAYLDGNNSRGSGGEDIKLWTQIVTTTTT